MLTRLILGIVLANVVSAWAVPAVAWRVAVLSDLGWKTMVKVP
jgi:hypothetical protein